MKMHIGMALEPPVVLGLVGIEIVEDDMDFFFVNVGVYGAIHEIQELERQILDQLTKTPLGFARSNSRLVAEALGDVSVLITGEVKERLGRLKRLDEIRLKQYIIKDDSPMNLHT